VSVDVDAQALQVGIPVTGGCYYKLVLVLAHPVKTAAYSTKRTKSKLTLKLGKEDATLQWALLGNVVLESCERVSAGMVSSFTSLELASVYRVTHDTRLFRLRGCCGSGSDLSTLWGSGEGLGRHVRMGVGGEDASAASTSTAEAAAAEEAFSCTTWFRIETWTWSRARKEYCCQHKGKACSSGHHPQTSEDLIF